MNGQTGAEQTLTKDEFREWKNSPATQRLFGDLKNAKQNLRETELDLVSCENIALSVIERQGFIKAVDVVLDWEPAELREDYE